MTGGFELFPEAPRLVRDRDAFCQKVSALQPEGDPSALQRARVCGS